MEEDGKSVKLPNFSYAGNSGPTNWQAIDLENVQCAAGQNQSPIDIKTAETAKTKAGDVKMDIPAGQKMTFENLGTNVEVLVEGTTTMGNRKFKLKQFHYHTPSEHKIDSEYYPVEVHMVHEAEGSSFFPQSVRTLSTVSPLTEILPSPQTTLKKSPS
jgi:carbonic anhydrase